MHFRNIGYKLIGAGFAFGLTVLPLASAEAQPLRSEKSFSVQSSGSHFCGVGVSYDACYSERADYVRHGYQVGPIFWASTMGGYAFDYWT